MYICFKINKMINKLKTVAVCIISVVLISSTAKAQDAKSKVVSKDDSLNNAAMQSKMIFLKNKELKEKALKNQEDSIRQAAYLIKLDSIRKVEAPFRAKMEKLNAEIDEANKLKAAKENAAKLAIINEVEIKKRNEENAKKLASEKIEADITAKEEAIKLKQIEAERKAKAEQEQAIKAKEQKIVDDKAMAAEQIRNTAKLKESNAKLDSITNTEKKMSARIAGAAAETAKMEAATIKEGNEILKNILNKKMKFASINGSEQGFNTDLEFYFSSENTLALSCSEGRMACNIMTQNAAFIMVPMIVKGQEVPPPIAEQLDMLQRVYSAKYYNKILTLLDGTGYVLATLKEK